MHSTDFWNRHRAIMGRRIAQLRRRSAIVGVAAVALTSGVRDADARKGGAQPPPPPTISGFLPKAGPVLPAFPPLFGPTGFSILGFIEKATVAGGCPQPPGSTAGGSVTVNGVAITVPSNMIVQFPAATLKWADAVCPSDAGLSPIGLDGSGGSGGAATLYPSTELRVEGNIVGAAGVPAGVRAPHVAALIYASQQSLNAGSGYISFIDYADGSIYVSTTGGEARLVINDPKGRFGRKQTSLDARFAVDDENPTIRAETGYPMCVPRAAPPSAGGAETDPLCPQKNRPMASATAPCRNFLAAGVALPGLPADLPPTPNGRFCTSFVMKAEGGMPGTATLAPQHKRAASDPDPRQQAPFEVGDFITWTGTLVRDASKPPPATPRAKPSTNLIWANSVVANIGIYTQPKTLPAYLAIGEFRVGVDPRPDGAPDGVAPIETTNRFGFEAFTTDVTSIVDAYFTDLNPGGAGAAQSYRWITVEGVTNTLADQLAGETPFGTSAQPFGGGIHTQFTEAVPGRARVSQNKVPAIDPTLGACPPEAGSRACAVTQSPTRYIRAVLRSLCAPTSAGGAGTPAGNPGNLDGGAFFDINGTRPPLSGAAAGDGSCLQSAGFANGLFTGQYSAPTTEFIFAEPTVPGTSVPNNLWQLDFLAHGEEGVNGNSTAAPSPRPW
ncbi:hypothetical protein [Methylocystis parvus]|uniref:hypothetical protein n=1 Tax=Methylocystis parvus TaxID=134 RepID=UPI003C74F556